jgi:hypothetical protein
MRFYRISMGAFVLASTASGFLQHHHQQYWKQLPRKSTIAPLGISFLEDLPNPFQKIKTSSVFLPFSDSNAPFEQSSAGIFRQAKQLLSVDFGLQDPSLLDDNFLWYGPVVDYPLGKVDFLAAGRFFNLRAAFPDLDYRAHDFRIDDQDTATVRLTCRVVGTMRGELRLRDHVLPPTGKTMKCPPEAVTLTFDLNTGKLKKMCSGFCMDRLVGNTAGTTGIMAAATVAGRSISDWEIYPPSTVLKRFVGRPVNQLPEPKSFLAPFPETVMVQLCKGILAANMATEDATLLAKSFTYSTPSIGPVNKNTFLASFALLEFEGVDPRFSHFRVDPYDPNVVWVDVLPFADGYIGAPYAMSFTFDDEGFCTRISSGAIIDPTIGNGGGLAGWEGYKYAKGEASFAILTRPLPRVLGRLRRRIATVFTGQDIDEYIGSTDVALQSTPSAPRTKDYTVSPFEKLSTLRAQANTASNQSSEQSRMQPMPQKSVPFQMKDESKPIFSSNSKSSASSQPTGSTTGEPFINSLIEQPFFAGFRGMTLPNIALPKLDSGSEAKLAAERVKARSAGVAKQDRESQQKLAAAVAKEKNRNLPKTIKLKRNGAC